MASFWSRFVPDPIEELWRLIMQPRAQAQRPQTLEEQRQAYMASLTKPWARSTAGPPAVPFTRPPVYPARGLPQGAGLNRPAALTGPGSTRERHPFTGRERGYPLAVGLNRMAFESGQAPKLVRHPDGGYGYKVESRAPQRHPLIQALQEIAGSAQPQQPQDGGVFGPVQPMPATPLPRSNGRIAPPTWTDEPPPKPPVWTDKPSYTELGLERPWRQLTGNMQRQIKEWLTSIGGRLVINKVLGRVTAVLPNGRSIELSQGPYM